MDQRVSRTYGSQKSINSSTPGTPSSPMTSPLHLRNGGSGTSGMSNVKRAQAKAATQRLAQVMSHQSVSKDRSDDDEDDDDNDLSYDYNAGSIGLAGGRKLHPKSPLIVPAQTKPAYRHVRDFFNDEKKPASRRNGQATLPFKLVDDNNEDVDEDNQSKAPQQTITRDNPEDDKEKLMGNRSLGVAEKISIGLAGAKSMKSRFPSAIPTKQELSQPAGHSVNGERSQAFNEVPSSSTPSAIRAEPSVSVRSPLISRTSSAFGEQPLSARSVSQTRLTPKVAPIPSGVSVSLKPVSTTLPSESPSPNRRDKRLSLDLGSIRIREPKNSNSALQDEIDMLQEENEHLMEKLRLAEERSQEADARAKQLAEQISALGEGVSLEARLLNRKEAALQQREAALKYAEQTNKPEKILALKTEFEAAKDEATTALEHLQEAEDEVRTLRKILARMILTQEEMEEMVLKRCWLARYWKLCVHHGVLTEVAEEKLEYWSSLAPLPDEIVLAAAHKVVNENELDNCGEDASNIFTASGDGNIESLLLVERGLRELSTLKIEDSIAVSMARKRRSNSLRPDDVKLPSGGQIDAFELSQEETEDVRFKQAWLVYFWRRAKNHEIEPDVAEERLQFWINHSSRSSTSHDAVDVQRGLMELRKLGIEDLLWQHSRKGLL